VQAANSAFAIANEVIAAESEPGGLLADQRGASP
jgi:hypothetical protein